MKIGWGRGIAIVYLSFMAMILAAVFYSTGFKKNMQVENYYQEEQNYNAKLESMNNAKKVEIQPKIIIKSGNILLDFESVESETGSVKMFRPSDNDMDHTHNLELDSDKKQLIDMSSKSKGSWIVQLSWQSSGKDYFIEEKVIL